MDDGEQKRCIISILWLVGKLYSLCNMILLLGTISVNMLCHKAANNLIFINYYYVFQHHNLKPPLECPLKMSPKVSQSDKISHRQEVVGDQMSFSRGHKAFIVRIGQRSHSHN